MVDDGRTRSTRERGLHPESVCLDLGNKSTLVKVSKRLWFRFIVNKYVVLKSLQTFFCIKPRP